MGLKELRIKKSYSQEKLAELSNLSTRTIQRIEKENKSSLESIRALSNVFQIEVSELKNIIENKEEVIKKYDSFFNYLLKNKETQKFLIINIFLFIINILTSDYLWFFYPLLIWGFFHIKKSYTKYLSLNN